MNVITSETLNRNWENEALSPEVSFSLSEDDRYLIFEAHRAASYNAHPLSQAGKFQPELWRYDVAELFLLEPKSERYLEINLAPNGGWWTSWFEAPRQPATPQPDFKKITTQAKQDAGGWRTSLSLPKALLATPSLSSLRYNVTFILNSPAQVFLSHAPLPGTEPDFHQPDHFLPWPP